MGIGQPEGLKVGMKRMREEMSEEILNMNNELSQRDI
jgi:hypothetical protein